MSGLENLVEALQSRVNTLAEFTHGGMDGLAIEEELEQNGDLLTRVERLERRLGEIETQLDAIQDLGNDKTSKDEKIAALVQYAQNRATNPEMGRVAVKAREIKGVAGVSRRYAYDLIDDLSRDYEWMLAREDVEQYGDLELKRESQTRAIVVDLEQLHSDDGAVNKFTTRTSGTGASA